MIRVGVISGQEIFTTTLVEALNARPGVQAEFVRLYETHLETPAEYDVLIDRLSHCLEYYQAYLKQAALKGTYVINNPFRFLSDDKFFNYALADKIGVAVPKTVLLPSREYDERVLEPEDLQNLGYPLDWDKIVSRVGLPAIFKPYDGYGWREVHKVESMEQLLELYNESMMDVMMLQEFIEFEHYVRCFVVGKKHVLPTHYDPVERRYIVDHSHLTPELGQRIVGDCIKICRYLGYDINTVEFAIRDGVPYAIDFMNPVPEAKPQVITPMYFSWLIEKVVEFVEEVGQAGKGSPYFLAEPLLT
ncbi:MAG: RimK family alpha-L-glutamate ligase [Vulcanimicrobiota bacterium]